MNIVLLHGVLSSAPRSSELPSGSVLIRWEVTTENEGHKLSVPVVWFDPPDTAIRVDDGDDVVVAGTVRRRFWQAGPTRTSTTEVVASAWAKPSRRRAVERLWQRALAQVWDEAGEPVCN